MPRMRHPRNLAGEGLAMRQQIRKALNRPQITQRDTDSGKAKKTSNAQCRTPEGAAIADATGAFLVSAKARQVMWAIKSRGGWMCNITCRRTDSIKGFLGNDPSQRWSFWRRKYGVRAVKVEVREL